VKDGLPGRLAAAGSGLANLRITGSARTIRVPCLARLADPTADFTSLQPKVASGQLQRSNPNSKTESGSGGVALLLDYAHSCP
jgi:hypothetical protein